MNTYQITYSAENSAEPVLSKVILETGVMVNILKADISQDRGVMIVNVIGSARDAKKVVDAFRKRRVRIERIVKKITLDRDACIDCGACVGLCPVDALRMDRHLRLQLEEDKCIQCRACVEACPMKALSIEE